MLKGESLLAYAIETLIIGRTSFNQPVSAHAFINAIVNLLKQKKTGNVSPANLRDISGTGPMTPPPNSIALAGRYSGEKKSGRKRRRKIVGGPKRISAALESEPKKGAVFDLRPKGIFTESKWEPKSAPRLVKPMARRVKRIVKQERKLQEETRETSRDPSGYDYFLNKSNYRLGDLESVYQPLDLPEISERHEICKCGKRKKPNHHKHNPPQNF